MEERLNRLTEQRGSMNKQTTTIEILDYIENLLEIEKEDFRRKQLKAVSDGNQDYHGAITCATARSVTMGILSTIMTDTIDCR